MRDSAWSPVRRIEPTARERVREPAGQTPGKIALRDGVLIGPLREPRNPHSAVRSLAHATAASLGFRHGTISGSTHLEQFPPLFLRAFGRRWFETGGVSMYFTEATIESEPVRGCVRMPPADANDAHVQCWLETADGVRVAEGSASVGRPDAHSALRERLRHPHAPGNVRILADREPGQRSGRIPVRIPLSGQQGRLARITEPLDWYQGASHWGGAILTPGALVQALRVADAGFGKLRGGPTLSFYEAIELQYERGPVFADREYRCTGELLAVGETPRSEYCWYRSELREPGEQSTIASMIMLVRYMKATSTLWQD